MSGWEHNCALSGIRLLIPHGDMGLLTATGLFFSHVCSLPVGESLDEDSCATWACKEKKSRRPLVSTHNPAKVRSNWLFQVNTITLLLFLNPKGNVKLDHFRVRRFSCRVLMFLSIVSIDPNGICPIAHSFVLLQGLFCSVYEEQHRRLVRQNNIHTLDTRWGTEEPNASRMIVPSQRQVNLQQHMLATSKDFSEGYTMTLAASYMVKVMTAP